MCVGGHESFLSVVLPLHHAGHPYLVVIPTYYFDIPLSPNPTCLYFCAKAAEEAAAAASSTGAFGQKQAMYANRHISSFIDVFRVAREKEGGTVASCTKLLEDMISIARWATHQTQA